jgi:hypothetical protein
MSEDIPSSVAGILFKILVELELVTDAGKDHPALIELRAHIVRLLRSVQTPLQQPPIP